MQIAICDDNNQELEQICALVSAYFERRPGLDVVLRHFASSFDLADALQSSRFDAYLLDIIMPQIDGIELGKLIRDRDSFAAIVYLSNSEEYALRAYSVQAYQYLLKPVAQTALYSVLDKLVEQKEAEESQIIPVRTRQGIRAIRMRDLMYAEGRARVYFYYLEDGQVIESVTMRENFDQVMEPLFGDRRFVKASASFVVNMGYATLMSGKGFQMKDGRNVSISRKSYAQIKRDFIDFLLDRGHGPAV